MHKTEKLILEYIKKNPGMTSKELGEVIKENVNHHLKEMTKSGILYRVLLQEKGVDYRSFYIYFVKKPTWKVLRKFLNKEITCSPDDFKEYVDLRVSRYSYNEKKYFIKKYLEAHDFCTTRDLLGYLGVNVHKILNEMVSAGEILRCPAKTPKRGLSSIYFLKKLNTSKRRKLSSKGYLLLDENFQDGLKFNGSFLQKRFLGLYENGEELEWKDITEDALNFFLNDKVSLLRFYKQSEGLLMLKKE